MPGMTCPYCGVATAYNPVEWAKQVQHSGAGAWSKAHLASGSIYDELSKYWFGLSRCQACSKAFPVRGTARTPEHPDQTYDPESLEPLWPTRYRSVPEEVPTPVREAMEDASAALGAGSVIGSMLAARTALIRTQRQQSVASLLELRDKGVISQVEYEAGNVTRHWANYLGHDEPDLSIVCEREDAEVLYEYVELVLHSTYVRTAKLNTLVNRLKGNGGEHKSKRNPTSERARGRNLAETTGPSS